MTKKSDAVFIRKSTKGQEEQSQIDNVKTLLKERGISIGEQQWFAGTVSRRKVKDNAEFKRMLSMVQDGQIRNIYVETQDRLGLKDSPELFWFIGELRSHGVKLIDLTENKDLTDEDFVTEIMVLIAGHKSQKELKDTSRRSLRTRVNNFKANGSWPTGTQPFGFGKACYSAAGELKWVWQPVSRVLGQVHYPSSKGLTPGPANQRIPRKEKTDRITLVPSDNPKFVKAVELVFDLYVRSGLSRRQISKRMNEQGYRYYDKQFTHTLVTQLLENPAYAGDIHFGKRQSGELHTFDANGVIVEPDKQAGKRKRNEAERIVKANTHQPLVDRKLWNKAQKKLACERERTSYVPINPDYYLKSIFVCGHCGKNLVGRKENGGKVVYVCASYVQGRSGGYESPCGYHRISHEDAETLLLGKIEEMGLAYKPDASAGVRSNAIARLDKLDQADDEARDDVWRSIEEGSKALVDYFKEHYELDKQQLSQLQTAAQRFYRFGRAKTNQKQELPIALSEFKAAVNQAEKAAATKAAVQVKELTQEHAAYTKAWVHATDRQQAVIKRELDDLEDKLKEAEARTLPVSQRLAEVYESENDRAQQRLDILKEWPTLEGREKGEALRQLFRTVTLYWEATWHPSEENPARPRKTKRAGRYSYRLETDRITWDFEKSNVAGTW